MKKTGKGRRVANGVGTLAELAETVGLTKGTISAVLNDSPSAKAIPQRTKDRILAAARKLDYQPNFFARNLRYKRTFTVGVVTEEIGDAYGGMVISGIEAFLSQHKYFFLTVAHRHDPQSLQQYLGILLARGVEGLITIDTNLKQPSPIPTVAIAGHRRVKGVTNIILDHGLAAHLALSHLVELGHRDLAFLRGQPYSSDSADRWRSICDVAQKLRIKIYPELAEQRDSDDPSPGAGYRHTKPLLSNDRRFSPIFAHNDTPPPPPIPP